MLIVFLKLAKIVENWKIGISSNPAINYWAKFYMKASVLMILRLRSGQAGSVPAVLSDKMRLGDSKI